MLGPSSLMDTAGAMLGMKRLYEHLGRLCAEGENCTAEELAQRLTDWLDDYRGGAPHGDDRTFLIARRV